MRYFRKFDPSNKIWTGQGFAVPFEVPIDNAEWGFLATDNNYVINQLKVCMQEVRGGVEEISQSQYEELKKKETVTRRPIWRDAVSTTKLTKLLNDLSERLAAEAERKAALPDVVRNWGEMANIARPQGISSIKVEARKKLLPA